MNSKDPEASGGWKKTADGYTIVDPKWGANLTLHTKETKTEEELNEILALLYANAKEPLPKGSNYSLFQPS